ncbi:hypothetical protein CK203_071714 [Vitis vinifera]|uniref:Uncharacterized protein n=1 Tax=Vitis vinifera TaxID=29760 RepID=A0A438C3A6_VITVI|nr:hypothetical protein CK203_071714 [Vitis vinifera]
MAMEALSCILKRAKKEGFLKGFLAGGRRSAGVEVSHLLFVDDTLILCNLVSEDLAKALGVKLVISHPPIWASHWELLEIIASLGCYSVELYKAIENGWEEFDRRVEFRVGNDRRIRVWKDGWNGKDSLEEAFLELFSLASTKDA